MAAIRPLSPLFKSWHSDLKYEAFDLWIVTHYAESNNFEAEDAK